MAVPPPVLQAAAMTGAMADCAITRTMRKMTYHQ